METPSEPESNFRVDRKKFGLTYSQAGGTLTKEIILDELIAKGGNCDYIVAQERHQDGGIHFHCYIKYETKLESRNARIFDILGIHPNICKGSVTRGWADYVAKDGDYITNFYKPSDYHHALSLETPDQAIAYLWAKKPRDMLLHGDNIERGVRKRLKVDRSVSYYGPYAFQLDWDYQCQSLIIEGPPGLGKTQFVKYYCKHNFGSYLYCSGSLRNLRNYAGQEAIIFDDLKFKDDFHDWRTLFDIENGGTIQVSPSGLYDYELPAGVPRIFIHNGDLTYDDPFGRLARRVHHINYN